MLERSAAIATIYNFSQTLSDETLVRGALLGDPHALAELWVRHSKKLFYSALRITRNEQDAEDALHEAFLNTMKHIMSFRGQSSFVSWQTRIVINCALSILRKRRLRREVGVDCDAAERDWCIPEVADLRANTEEAFVTFQEGQRLEVAIRKLRPIFRTVLELRPKEDQSIADIARRTGLSESAIKSRLVRARKILCLSLTQLNTRAMGNRRIR